MSFIIIRSSAYDYLVFLFQFDLSIAGYKSIWHMIEFRVHIYYETFDFILKTINFSYSQWFDAFCVVNFSIALYLTLKSCGRCL